MGKDVCLKGKERKWEDEIGIYGEVETYEGVKAPCGTGSLKFQCQ